MHRWLGQAISGKVLDCTQGAKRQALTTSVPMRAPAPKASERLRASAVLTRRPVHQVNAVAQQGDGDLHAKHAHHAPIAACGVGREHRVRVS